LLVYAITPNVPVVRRSWCSWNGAVWRR